MSGVWNRVLGAAAGLLPDRLVRLLLLRRHPFDLRHGTDTGGLMYGPELATGNPNDQFNEGYYATAPSVFRGLISRWEDTLSAVGASEPALNKAEGSPSFRAWDRKSLRISDYDFIDLGCGKGRVLLLAGELPFRSVTGIELNPALCAVAEENVRRWRRRTVSGLIEVVCGDVLSAPIPALLSPDRPVVLFLFNSFGLEVIQPLLDKLIAAARARTAPIDLLYVHPDWAAMVERAPGVQTLFDGEIPFTREDHLADAFGVNVDRCSIYRIGAAQRGA